MPRALLRTLSAQFRDRYKSMVKRLFSIVAVVLFFGYANGQSRIEPCWIGSHELGRGIIAADGLATITGRAFTDNPQPTEASNPTTEKSGVTVKIGGIPARIRSVSFDSVSIIAPVVRSYGWNRVSVESSLGRYAGWVVVMPVSAEIFTNHCQDSIRCINGMPFGGAWVNLSQVIPLFDRPIPNNNTQIWINGSGWRHSPRVVAWIADEFGGETAIECKVSPDFPFTGWDIITFNLPPTINRNGVEVPLKGKVTFQLAAQQPLPFRWWSYANLITLDVVEPGS